MRRASGSCSRARCRARSRRRAAAASIRAARTRPRSAASSARRSSTTATAASRPATIRSGSVPVASEELTRRDASPGTATRRGTASSATSTRPETPVVICHGGPGAAHDYTEPIADLSRFGRACVLYDQLGCGKSEHLPDAPAEFWTPQLFKDELVALTRHLGIDDRHAVVGQSWGGMLAMEYALDHPQRPARDRRRRLAGEHDALGVGGEPPARATCRRTSRRR